jgi:regulator of protease activity HflC (stomatin/prohibitin superfamily)
VQAVDTLIGDITPPEKLMDTLTDRKVAEQRKITFETQEAAEKQRQEFERARSEADTRGQVVQASRAAEVAKLNADAAINTATGQAGAKTINAEADAKVIFVTGEASARKTQLVGDAEAGVLKKKVDAVGAPYYALMNVVDQLSLAKTALVPQIQVQGGGDRDGRPTLVDAFIGNLLAQNMKGPDKDASSIK